MDRMVDRFQPLDRLLTAIQAKLNLESWRLHPQFATRRGLGRVALLAAVLGTVWGISGTVCLFLSLERLGFWKCESLLEARADMLWNWSFYLWSLCNFHLLEFFVTAIYNPKVTSADDFLVNHSKAYTAAFIIASAEFWLRFWLVPASFPHITRNGIIVLLFAQLLRSLAMKTCGESFNHLIQTSKKTNHTLVTKGVYQYFRHPSYAGFFYWSVATQLVLNNLLSTILFGMASLMFFRRRIPYEEECLMEHFPNDEYLNYARTTFIGIPYIPTSIETRSLLDPSPIANPSEVKKKT